MLDAFGLGGTPAENTDPGDDKPVNSSQSSTMSSPQRALDRDWFRGRVHRVSGKERRKVRRIRRKRHWAPSKAFSEGHIDLADLANSRRQAFSRTDLVSRIEQVGGHQGLCLVLMPIYAYGFVIIPIN